jgi:hypothetical protein
VHCRHTALSPHRTESSADAQAWEHLASPSCASGDGREADRPPVSDNAELSCREALGAHALSGMAADPLAEVKDKVAYCCGGEHAIGRGIFHLPEQDPLAPPKYVSVRSQQVLSSIAVTLVFLLNLLVIRLAIFTNDVCDGAGRIFIALMLLSLLTSAVMYVQPAPLPARQ